MPAPAGIRWTVPPRALARAIEQYGDKVMVAVAAVAGRIATLMQNRARANAPWTDRTGNARGGLFGTSERDAARHLVTIYLSHSPILDYGVYLETANGGKNAIIGKTVEAHLPELHKMLQDIFG